MWGAVRGAVYIYPYIYIPVYMGAVIYGVIYYIDGVLEYHIIKDGWGQFWLILKFIRMMYFKNNSLELNSHKRRRLFNKLTK